MAQSGRPRVFPVLGWARSYSRGDVLGDLTAAVIVTIMLIPQSLAYALLAGLPPEMGLYASILPLMAYAFFGTSRTLSVGPVAILSLMTAASVGALNLATPAEYASAAVALAALSGLMLLAAGMFRLGFLANFLSHPVIAGFIAASGLLIAATQMRHILGVDAQGHTLPDIAAALWAHRGAVHPPTLALGLGALGFLLWVRGGLKPLLVRAGLAEGAASSLARTGPVLAVAATVLITVHLSLDKAGVAVVGAVPQGLPAIGLPLFDAALWQALLLPAALLSLIGFVESVSVAQTLAAKRRQRIDPDQELIGLGAANLAAGASNGFPVTGGFARSVVNFDAGARTPAAGVLAAVGIAGAAAYLTPLIHFLPKATLAATIIVAVLSLIDLSILRRTWAFSKADFAAVSVTMAVTLGLGVEAGVAAGVALSLLLHIGKTARPHIAEVGLVPGTEHFRNINRHQVETSPALVTLRVDESLYFANARFLEDAVYDRVVGDRQVRHVVLMFSAVNEVDTSALHSLEAINERLRPLDIALHLSEVKGPVMDRLARSSFLEQMTGRIFLSQYQAWAALSGAPTAPRSTAAA